MCKQTKQMITIPVEHYNYLKEREYASAMFWNAFEAWRNSNKYSADDNMLEAMFGAINNVFTVNLKEVVQVTIEDLEEESSGEELF